MVRELLALNTARGDEAVWFLSVYDDIFSEMHAVCHARLVLAGEPCNACDHPIAEGAA
jgi:hypothetical protein